MITGSIGTMEREGGAAIEIEQGLCDNLISIEGAALCHDSPLWTAV
jgi:hypothetical protein